MISIGDLEFKTKVAAKQFVKKLIYELGECVVERKHSKFAFFSDLLKNHSEYAEKVGCGVDYFSIQRHRLNPKYLEIQLTRMDRTSVIFGWNCCATMSQKSVKSNLSTAMRTAISYQVLRFRKNAEIVCKICNTCKGNMHVDHLNPSFHALATAFLENRDAPNTFMMDDHLHMYRFKVDDAQFEKEWKEFHAQNATYQIMCQSCNIKKGKN